MIHRVILLVVVVVLLFVAAFSTALAASTGNAGQPNQSCQAQPSAPGNAVSAGSSRGSPFGSTAFSATVYAGTTNSLANANSTAAVSQYDVACFQVSQPHP